MISSFKPVDNLIQLRVNMPLLNKKRMHTDFSSDRSQRPATTARRLIRERSLKDNCLQPQFISQRKSESMNRMIRKQRSRQTKAKDTLSLLPYAKSQSFLRVNTISTRFTNMRNYLQVRPRQITLSKIVSNQKAKGILVSKPSHDQMRNMNRTFVMTRRKNWGDKNHIRKILKTSANINRN